MTPEPQEPLLPLLALHERTRYRAAADYALRRYPGPVGELIHRELSAYADFGHRFAQDALIPHLAREVLTPPAPPRDPDGTGEEDQSGRRGRHPHGGRAA